MNGLERESGRRIGLRKRIYDREQMLEQLQTCWTVSRGSSPARASPGLYLAVGQCSDTSLCCNQIDRIESDEVARRHRVFVDCCNIQAVITGD